LECRQQILRLVSTDSSEYIVSNGSMLISEIVLDPHSEDYVSNKTFMSSVLVTRGNETLLNKATVRRIEKASGESYGKFLQENIFGSLGIKDSTVDSNSALILRRAAGYTPSKGGPQNAGSAALGTRLFSPAGLGFVSLIF
jgi:hypothetical protein